MPVKLSNWEALRTTLNNLDSLIEAPRAPNPPTDIPNHTPYTSEPESWIDSPSQPPNIYPNNFPPRLPNAAPPSGYPNGGATRPFPAAFPSHDNPNPGFTMPPTAAQLTAMQSNLPHPTSHASLDSRSESPFAGRAGELNYELSAKMPERMMSPVSPALSEVHNESLDVGGRGRGEERRTSEVSGFTMPGVANEMVGRRGFGEREREREVGWGYSGL